MVSASPKWCAILSQVSKAACQTGYRGWVVRYRVNRRAMAQHPTRWAARRSWRRAAAQHPGRLRPCPPTRDSALRLAGLGGRVSALTSRSRPGCCTALGGEGRSVGFAYRANRTPNTCKRKRLPKADAGGKGGAAPCGHCKAKRAATRRGTRTQPPWAASCASI